MILLQEVCGERVKGQVLQGVEYPEVGELYSSAGYSSAGRVCRSDTDMQLCTHIHRQAHLGTKGEDVLPDVRLPQNDIDLNTEAVWGEQTQNWERGCSCVYLSDISE